MADGKSLRIVTLELIINCLYCRYFESKGLYGRTLLQKGVEPMYATQNIR